MSSGNIHVNSNGSYYHDYQETSSCPSLGTIVQCVGIAAILYVTLDLFGTFFGGNHCVLTDFSAETVSSSSFMIKSVAFGALSIIGSYVIKNELNKLPRTY